MRKLLLFFCILFLTINSYSQSYLDIIRASSYYSNAVNTFNEGNYQSTLINLQLSEKSLQGKTNRDLEYLKIMANYHLSNFKEAYKLTKEYFEKGFAGRKVSFRNITSYGKTNGIDYEEQLTNMFVTFEEKSNDDQNISLGNTMQQIIAKIEKSKVSFTNYLSKATLTKVSEKIDYCLRETSNGVLKRIYENNYLNLTKQSASKKHSFYFTGTISGKAIATSKYKFEVSFAKLKPSLTQNEYTYGYKQSNVRYINGKVTLTKKAYQCYSLTAPERQSSYFSKQLISKFRDKNFTQKDYNEKTYTVIFSPQEVHFLKQGDNLNKLNRELKAKNLL